MANLTDKQIQLAKAGTKDEFLSDGAGLYLRVRTSGQKIWLYRYKVDAKTRWLDMGSYPSLTLKSARADAAKLSVDRRNGIDPIEQRNEEEDKVRAEKAQKEARLTVSDLLDRWEKLELKNRKDKGAEVRRSFTKDVLPIIGDTPVEEVTRVMIAQVLDSVVSRGSSIIARNMLGDIRQMFGFAIVRGLTENDPTSHMKRDNFGKKVERDRVLNEEEVKLLAKILPNADLQESSIATIWIMLSTCCRVGEISQASWEHIDLTANTWRIPPDNAKNAKEHTVYLSDFAKIHFQTLQRIADEKDSEPTPWVLTARNRKDHVCIKSLAKQIGDRQRNDKAPLKNRSKLTQVLELPRGKWTPHDLRRTGATLMGNIGVRPDVIEKCLNHVEQNRLIRIYQRQKLETEQRAAWVLLGDHLSSLIATPLYNEIPS